VIAYSTMSQIGYMFLGAGLGAYANAMFHLMTHAFFKALLFMAAGIVIHALADEQDIRKLAGAGRLFPVTRIAFLIGSLALVGILPFAGFFSKDPIIASGLVRGWYGYLLLAAALAGTFLTGLYTWRLFMIVFTGEPSAFVREHFEEHHGEAPFSMMAPTLVLAVLSVIGGWIQFAPFWHPVSDWLDTVAAPLAKASNTDEAVASILAVALGLAGLAIAYLIYGSRRLAVPQVAWAQTLLERKFYFDEAYDAAFYRPSVALAVGLDRWFEQPVIGGSIKEFATGVRDLALGTRRLQTGLVRTYALAIAASLAVLMIVFVAVR
jgi:NADH-quinone oxidoreductase subunit L